MRVKIFIKLKRAVLDPQGKATEHALIELGYDAVNNVRIGKVIEFNLAMTDKQAAASLVESMCKKLLVNEVIEEYDYDLIDL